MSQQTRVMLISVRNVVKRRAFLLTCLEESTLKFWDTIFGKERAVRKSILTRSLKQNPHCIIYN